MCMLLHIFTVFWNLIQLPTDGIAIIKVHDAYRIYKSNHVFSQCH